MSGCTIVNSLNVLQFCENLGYAAKFMFDDKFCGFAQSSGTWERNGLPSIISGSIFLSCMTVTLILILFVHMIENWMQSCLDLNWLDFSNILQVYFRFHFQGRLCTVLANIVGSPAFQNRFQLAKPYFACNDPGVFPFSYFGTWRLFSVHEAWI